MDMSEYVTIVESDWKLEADVTFLRQVSLYMFTILLQQGLQISTNVWLKNWSERNATSGDNGYLPYYLGMYRPIRRSEPSTLIIFSCRGLRCSRFDRQSCFPVQWYLALLLLRHSRCPHYARFNVRECHEISYAILRYVHAMLGREKRLADNPNLHSNRNYTFGNSELQKRVAESSLRLTMTVLIDSQSLQSRCIRY